MGNFKNLKVWQKATDLAVKIYEITSKEPWSKDFRFKDQIRAAAISIPSNIAEGDESGTNPNSIRYFNMALGSSAEVITQLIIAERVAFISKEQESILEDEYEHVRAMLKNLIKSRR